MTAPNFARGDVVMVREEGIAPRTGTVLSVKPRGKRWAVEVRFPPVGLTYVVDSERVSTLSRTRSIV